MELNEEAKNVGFLLRRGFNLISSQYSESFGNYSLVLEQDYVRVRITRDRYQYLVNVAPALHPEEWFDLPLVLQAFDIDKSSLKLKALETQAVLLEKVLPMYGRQEGIST